jgi:hypothetical protein
MYIYIIYITLYITLYKHNELRSPSKLSCNITPTVQKYHRMCVFQQHLTSQIQQSHSYSLPHNSKLLESDIFQVFLCCRQYSRRLQHSNHSGAHSDASCARRLRLTSEGKVDIKSSVILANIFTSLSIILDSFEACQEHGPLQNNVCILERCWYVSAP